MILAVVTGAVGARSPGRSGWPVVRVSDVEREERRARDRERLKLAAEQLLSSEGWQRWVRARARNGLARYSVSNLCLVVFAN